MNEERPLLFSFFFLAFNKSGPSFLNMVYETSTLDSHLSAQR
jgi:hypothetical protein